MASSSFFAVLLAAITVSSCLIGTKATTFTIKNNCGYTIWPGVQDNSGSPSLGTTGFELAAGATQAFGAPAGWGGRFWARTGCNSGAQFTCASADCGSGQVSCNGNGGAPPASLAEFTLNGNGGSTDNYDLSLVDGFNLPLSITPQSGGCDSRTCNTDINGQCPAALQLVSNGAVVGCKSACAAFNTAEYCCTGDHNTAATCPPTDYSNQFKNWCPEAYSYAYDDHSSLRTCPSGGDYVIQFC